MQTPVFAEIFACQECGKAVTSHRRWCSANCKLRAWTRAHPDKKYLKTKERVCPMCQQVFTSAGKTYCSETCKLKAKKPKQHITRICVECSQVFTAHARTSKQVTCSLTCRRARLRTLLKGKKYRPWKVHELTCAECQRAFTSSHKTTPICERCLRRKYGHGKPERRAKKAGVPYVYGIKPEQVFARNGWRCQFCGCKTPQRLGQLRLAI